MGKSLLLSLPLLLIPFLTAAWPPSDSTQGRLIEWYMGTHQASFLRHNQKLTTQTGQWVPGLELGVQFPTNGHKNWEAAHRLPTYGLAVVGLYPGPEAHGFLTGVFPHLSLPLLRARWIQAYFRVGTGLGWTSHPHDSFKNSGENALGSYFNNITQFRFSATVPLGSFWKWELAGAFNHFSNGGYELPNLGMNFPGIYTGLVYAPNRNQGPISVPSFDRSIDQKWGWTLQAGFAKLEYGALDGPKYAQWSATLALTRYLHRYNRVGFGLDLEQHKGLEAWILANGNLSTLGATRSGIFLSDEFLFGPLGIYLQAGYHVGLPQMNAALISRNFNKLALRYYWPTIRHSRVQIYTGLGLKAYKAIAECISFNIGFQG